MHVCILCQKMKPVLDGVSPFDHSSKLFICFDCKRVNWDGISPIYEKRFEDAVQQINVELPCRNERGLYPVKKSF